MPDKTEFGDFLPPLMPPASIRSLIPCTAPIDPGDAVLYRWLKALNFNSFEGAQAPFQRAIADPPRRVPPHSRPFPGPGAWCMIHGENKELARHIRHRTVCSCATRVRRVQPETLKGGTPMKVASVTLVLGMVLAPVSSLVLAQGSVNGYVTDTRGAVIKSASALCVRTGYWTPAMAIAECDPDLVPRAAVAPASRAAAPVAPPPAPAARPAPPTPPAPAQAPAQKPAAAAAPKRCDGTVTLASDELFAFGNASLSSAARTRIDRDVLPRIASCSKVEAVVIEGHTDRLGSHQFNQKLSERRADAVKKYLVSKGMSGDSIETIGMGKTAPAKFCPDEKDRKALIACLAPNRRVSISIKGPAK